jgi:predicted nucleic acid-binding protein
MSEPHVDTDVIIRLLTGDDPKKQAAARALFESVEAQRLSIAAPDTVIADAVFVLSSPRLYAQSRAHVSAMLSRLVRLPSFKVAQRKIVLAALALYGEQNIDFGDAMIAASLRDQGQATVYSYDQDFDRFTFIHRSEP